MSTGKQTISVERYLTYLDKEMTIMGILSGFCVAALAAGIKTLTDKDVAITGYLLHGSSFCLVIAHVFALLAALWFYRQRSTLAWYYGQISLEDSGYSTGTTVHGWLRSADAWDTWINYQRAFWFLLGACCELGLAGWAGFTYAKNGHHEQLIPIMQRWGAGLACAVLTVAVAVIQKLILEKWPQEEDPYENFRRAPLQIFKKE